MVGCHQTLMRIWERLVALVRLFQYSRIASDQSSYSHSIFLRTTRTEFINGPFIGRSGGQLYKYDNWGASESLFEYGQ